jgi:hypothetical protein
MLRWPVVPLLRGLRRGGDRQEPAEEGWFALALTPDCGDLGRMVDVAGIEDKETLEAWLVGRGREDAVCFAHRATMRVAPRIWAKLGEPRAWQTD